MLANFLRVQGSRWHGCHGTHTFLESADCNPHSTILRFSTHTPNEDPGVAKVPKGNHEEVKSAKYKRYRVNPRSRIEYVGTARGSLNRDFMPWRTTLFKD